MELYKSYFSNIANVIARNIKKSKISIDIGVTWFTNRDLYNILINKIKAGVPVRILTINDEINNSHDSLDWQKLVDLGAEIYFCEPEKMFHSKYAIFDKQVLITGSYNWTYNAELYSSENVIEISDRNFIVDFISNFENSIKVLTKILQNERIELTPNKRRDYFSQKSYKAKDLEALGDVYFQDEDFEAAKDSYIESLVIAQQEITNEIIDENVRMINKYVENEYESNNVKENIENNELIIKDNIEKLMKVSISEYHQAQYNKALKTFETILEIDETRYDVYVFIASIKEKQNEYEQVPIFYKKARKKGLEDLIYYHRLGNFYQRINNKVKALNYLEKAYNLNSNHFLIFYDFLQLLEDSHDFLDKKRLFLNTCEKLIENEDSIVEQISILITVYQIIYAYGDNEHFTQNKVKHNIKSLLDKTDDAGIINQVKSLNLE